MSAPKQPMPWPYSHGRDAWRDEALRTAYQPDEIDPPWAYNVTMGLVVLCGLLGVIGLVAVLEGIR